MATTHLYKHYNSSLEKANVFVQKKRAVGGGVMQLLMLSFYSDSWNYVISRNYVKIEDKIKLCWAVTCTLQYPQLRRVQ